MISEPSDSIELAPSTFSRRSSGAVLGDTRRPRSPPGGCRRPRAGRRSARKPGRASPAIRGARPIVCDPICDRAVSPPTRDARLVEVHRRRPDERGDEHVGRVVVQVLRRVDLLQVAVLEHGDAVAHRHRLDLVVGDVDGGDAEVALQARRSRRASARAAWRRGSTAARPSGTPPAGARSPGPSPPAGAGRRRAGPACGRGTARARGSPPPCGPGVSISSFGTLASLSAKPMLSYTVMCGYSA